MNIFERMESFYRLLLSALSVPWRSYIMAREVQLFNFIWSKDQECFYSNVFYSYLFIAYVIHHTGCSLIRYLYVKASLSPQVAEGYLSRRTFYVCLGVPQILLLLHIFLFYFEGYHKNEEFPFLFYQACKNPYSDYSMQFYKLMPMQQFLLYNYFGLMVYSNIYLYRFLR